ncbi:MAG: hypothetical protein ACJ8AI_23630 [Rhodopila sp.]
MTRIAHHLRRAFAVSAVAAATLCCPPPAQARVFVGVGVGVPFFGPWVPPPVYYPPPVFYAPPPVYYTPPQAYAPPSGSQAAAGATASRQSCYAGAYVCPMDRLVPSGATCWCAANNGQRVFGQAN